jgi:hypothetical protein
MAGAYQVQPSDTWDSVATANGITASQLQTLNGIDPTASSPAPLDVGQIITLPNPPRSVWHGPTATNTASTRQYTRSDWQWVAMKNAFGETTAAAIRAGTAWNVGPGSSFQANRDIIHAVYDYYGGLYNRNPSKCIWGGLGRVAGGPFFWGFQFIDNAIQMINQDPCQFPDNWTQAFKDLIACNPEIDPTAIERRGAEAVIASYYLQPSIETLMSMGKLIFYDLAWQHEAYLGGGLSEILRLGAQPGVFDSKDDRQRECLDAWRLIDSSDAGNASQGNLRLFSREQLYTISPGYALLQGRVLEPQTISFLAASPHPWGKSFFDWNGGNGPPTWNTNISPAPSNTNWIMVVMNDNVTIDAQRWAWMSQNIYPTWMGASEDKRATMVNLTLEALCAHQWPAGL